MKIFGFNITRDSQNQSLVTHPQSPVQRTLDPAAVAWLRGEEPDAVGPVLTNAYQQVVWVYRAVNALAEQVANVPFVFSRGERGRENLVTSGPLMDFYARPHPQLSRFEYWELRVIWLMLRGECFRVPIFSDDRNPNRNLNPSSLAAPKSDACGSRNTEHATRLDSRSRRRQLEKVLILDPSHFQHIIQDHQLVGWRYTGFGNSTPLASQIFLPEERSEEHTSELQSRFGISYAVFCLKK